MTFDDLNAGETIFLDANTLVYHFIPFPVLGPLCTRLIERVGRNELTAFTSTHVVSEAAHRLMTTEASQKFGWTSKAVDRLKRDPTRIQELRVFRDAVERIPQLGVQTLNIPESLAAVAAGLSIQHGLLTNDALIVAVMQANGLTNIASNDADFDRVPALSRYVPA